MATTSSRILSIYKSRLTLLDLLLKQDFNVDEYEGFSINEIDAMFSNSQLDMLLSHKTDGRKVYVKYYFSAKQTAKQIRPANLDEIIEDLFAIENILTKKDTLMIIIDDEPNDTIISKIKYLFDHDGIFVVIHNIQRLQFNILNHTLVPKTTILTDDEVAELAKVYHLKSDLSGKGTGTHGEYGSLELPEVSRFDPVSLAICMRPGQICKIERESATALAYNYYRICV
jgi:DNA-directed RNA polymerase subunit H (RpoH/RPB5)